MPWVEMFELWLHTESPSVLYGLARLDEVKYDGLYEGHAVKKFFAISISSLPTDASAVPCIDGTVGPLLGRGELSTPGARRVAPEGARG